MKKITLILIMVLFSLGNIIHSQTGWYSMQPFTSKSIYGISQTGTYTIYSCTDSGSVYKYINNGNNWSLFLQDTSIKRLAIRTIIGESNDNWEAVGDSTLYIVRYQGTTYTGRIVTSPNQTKPNLNAFMNLDGFFPAPSIAAGDSGLVYRKNGSSWRRDTLAIRLAAGREINSGRNNILVGNGGLILKADSVGYPGGDGIKWKIIPSGTTQNLYSIFTSGNLLMAVGAGGVILKSTNTGLNWTLLPSPTTQDLYACWIGYASLICGANGTILRTTSSNYDNWYRQNTPVTASLYTIMAIGYQEYVCMGANGTILHTTDSGGPPIGIIPISNKIPDGYSLSQNYPNPFNPSTKIRFSIPAAGTTRRVALTVFNILGEEVTTLVNQQIQPGNYEVEWDASNIPSGTYFYKLESSDFSSVKKMILIK